MFPSLLSATGPYQMWGPHATVLDRPCIFSSALFSTLSLFCKITVVSVTFWTIAELSPEDPRHWSLIRLAYPLLQERSLNIFIYFIFFISLIKGKRSTFKQAVSCHDTRSPKRNVRAVYFSWKGTIPSFGSSGGGYMIVRFHFKS